MATSSLPVPLSPRTRTPTRRGATLTTSSITRRMPGDVADDGWSSIPEASWPSATCSPRAGGRCRPRGARAGESVERRAARAATDSRKRRSSSENPPSPPPRSSLSRRPGSRGRHRGSRTESRSARGKERPRRLPDGARAVCPSAESSRQTGCASNSSPVGRSSGQPTTASARLPAAASRVTATATAGSSTAQTPLEELVDQLLLLALGMQLQREIVERLELQQPPPVGEARGSRS